MKVSDLKKDKVRSFRVNKNIWQYCKDKGISLQKLLDKTISQSFKVVDGEIKKKAGK